MAVAINPFERIPFKGDFVVRVSDGVHGVMLGVGEEIRVGWWDSEMTFQDDAIFEIDFRWPTSIELEEIRQKVFRGRR